MAQADVNGAKKIKKLKKMKEDKKNKKNKKSKTMSTTGSGASVQHEELTAQETQAGAKDCAVHIDSEKKKKKKKKLKKQAKDKEVKSKRGNAAEDGARGKKKRKREAPDGTKSASDGADGGSPPARRQYDTVVLEERAAAAAQAAGTEEFVGRASMIDVVARVYAANPAMGSKPLYRLVVQEAGGQRHAPSAREVRKMLAAIKAGRPLQTAVEAAQPFSRPAKLAKAALRRQEAGPANEEGKCKVFVANMSFSVDEPALQEFFGDCGDIVDIMWLNKPAQDGSKRSGKSTEDKLFTGNAFLQFSTPEAARAAVGKHGHVFGERELNINFARARKPGRSDGATPGKWGEQELGPRPDGCTTVFMGNLPYDIDDATLHEWAKESGVITGIRWLTDRTTGKFKGCGFVDFADEESLDDFVAAKNGATLNGRVVRIDYATGKQQADSGLE